jgi:hypothetical protein
MSPLDGREPLEAWLYGTHVADLSPTGDQVDLTWTTDAADRWGLGSRIVSNLLPIGRGGARPHPPGGHCVPPGSARRGPLWTDDLRGHTGDFVRPKAAPG